MHLGFVVGSKANGMVFFLLYKSDFNIDIRDSSNFFGKISRFDTLPNSLQLN